MVKKTKWIIGTLAQILIIVILLPIIMKVFSFFINFSTMSKGGSSFFADLIGSIPLFHVNIDIVTKYFDVVFSPDQLNQLNSFSTLAILSTFFQAIITAVSVKIFVSIHKLISINGAPIFASFLGILCATIINYFLAKNSSALGLILSNVIAIAVVLVGLFFMKKAVFSQMNMRKSTFVLDLIVVGLSGIITSLYLGIIVMAVNGLLGNFSKTFSICLIFSVIEFINLAIMAALSIIYDQEERNHILS